MASQRGGDVLDDLLGLEDEFYQEGFQLGAQDGTRAGYEEGNIFAMEKGYEKFLEMGQLYGRAIVWARQLPGGHGLLQESGAQLPVEGGGGLGAAAANADADASASTGTGTGSDGGGSSRLQKHVAQLLHLVDPATLPYENTEEGVNEFDDRLKRAGAKAKLIEKLVGESERYQETEVKEGRGAAGNIEDVASIPQRLLGNAE
ncbi:hypothetical protein KEM52_000273 [Ascosphaera acerosa]|nr:hypothetical protein KEM52_000273 [Ascosphaera acerosa]